MYPVKANVMLSNYSFDVSMQNYFADEEKRLNATYIISVARKLGCSIFLLPEDIMEVIEAFYKRRTKKKNFI